MNRQVDERVVEMRFDNKDFERNVSQSQKSLDNFKKKCNFDDSAKSFKNLEKASRDADFSPMTSAIETIGHKFSVMEVAAITAISNIVNSAVNAGKQLVSALTVDQISAGWNKYAEMTSSVQTIMGATSNEIEDAGERMEYVSEQMQKLNWYTDETSYNLTDMASNIGKFTNNGVALDKSVTAMMGIANWAAKSGSNAGEASRAMYNLSQALSSGSLKLIDWRSIELANMGTTEFKNAAIETAAAMGMLKETADGTFVTIDKGLEVSSTTFRDTLQTGWLSSDVLIGTLDKYGRAVEEINKIVNKTNVGTTSQLLEYVEEFKALTSAAEQEKYLADISKELGASTAYLREEFELLNSAEYQFSVEAFRAAQEAKTFQEAINATKDATSTAWLNIFQTIFGEYNEAKKTWTKLANELWDVFTGPLVEFKENVLDLWRSFGDGTSLKGGPKALMDSFWSLWDTVREISGSIKEAWQDIFPPMTWLSLTKLVDKFREFTERIKPTEETLERIKRAFQGFFSIFDIGKQILEAIWQTIKDVFSAFNDMGSSVTESGGGILEFLARIGDKVSNFVKWLRENETFKTVFGLITAALKLILTLASGVIKLFSGLGSEGSLLKTIFETLSGVIQKVTEWMTKLTDKIREKIESQQFKDFQNILVDIKDAVKAIWDALKVKIITPAWEALKGFFHGFSNTLDGTKLSFGSLIDSATKGWNDFSEKVKSSPLLDFLKSTFDFLGEITKYVMDVAKGFMKSTGEALKKGGLPALLDMLKSIATILLEGKLIKALTNFGETFSSLKGFFNELTNVLSSMTKKIQADAILKIALAIGVLTASVILLSFIEPTKLVTSLGALAAMFAILAATLKIIQGSLSGKVLKDFFQTKALKAIGVFFIELSAAMLIMAFTLKKLSGISWDQMLVAVGGMVAILGALLGAYYIITKLGDSNIGTIGKAMAITLTLIAIGIAVSKVAKAFIKLAQLSWDGILRGLAGLAAVTLATLVLAKTTEKNKKGLVSLIGLGLSLLAISAVMKILSTLSWEELGKGLAGLAGGLLVLVLAMKGLASTKGLLRASVSLTILAGSLLVLAAVLKIFSTMSWEDIGKSLAMLAGALGLIIAAGFLAKKAAGGLLALGLAFVLIGAGAVLAGAGLILIATGINLIISSLAVLGKSAKVLAEGLKVALGAIIELIPYLFSKLAEGIGEFFKNLGGAVQSIINFFEPIITAVLDLLIEKIPDFVNGVMTFVMTVLDSLAANTPAIVDRLFDILVGILDGIARNIGRLVQPLLDMIKNLMSSLADGIAGMDFSDILGAIEGLTLIGVIIGEFAAIVPMLPVAAVGAVGAVAIIAELATLLAGVGQGFNPEQLENIRKAIPVIAEVGRAIGDFIGGIFGGIAEGFSAGLPGLANNLSSFMTNLQPFINGAKDISPTDMTGVSALMDALLNLTKADFISQLTGWLFGDNKSTLSELGDELVDFGTALHDYSKAILGEDGSGIDSKAIEASAQAGLLLAEVANAVPRFGGVAQFFAGTTISMSEFASGLQSLGRAIKIYSDTITADGGIDANAISSSATGLTELSDIYATLPKIDGVAQFLSGTTISFDDFGRDLQALGRSIKIYSDTITSDGGISAQAITDSANALTVLADLSNNLPKLDGVVQWFTGTTMSLDTFGNQLKKLGAGIKGYSDAITKDGGINPIMIRKSAAAMGYLTQIANDLPKEKGVWQFLSGSQKGFDSFGEELPKLGRGLSSYSTSIKGVGDWSSVKTSSETLSSLITALSGLPKEGGFLGLILGSTDSAMSGLSASLGDLGTAMHDYATNIGTVDFAGALNSLDPLTGLVKCLADLKNTDKGWLGAMFGGDMTFTNFGTQLTDLAEAFIPYVNQMGELSETSFKRATSSTVILSSLITALNNLPIIDYGSGLRKITLGEFSADIKKFGESLADKETSFVPVLASISTKDLDSALSVANKIGGLMTALDSGLPTETGKLAKWFGSESKMSFDDAATGLPAFGEGMKSLIESVNSITYDSESIKRFTEVVNTLTGISTIDPSRLNSFNAQLKSIGDLGVQSFLEPFTNITTEFDANTVVQSLMDTLSTELTNNSADFNTKLSAILTAVLTNSESIVIDATSIGKQIGSSLRQGIINDQPNYEYRMRAVMTVMRDAANEKLEIFYTLGQNIASKVSGGVDSKYSDLYEAGKHMANGLLDGASSKISAAEQAGIELANALDGGVRTAGKIKSPSRLMATEGNFMGQGYILGVLRNLAGAEEAGETLVDKTVDGLRETLYKIGAAIDSDMDITPVIRPVVDLSDVEVGASHLTSMLSQNAAYGVQAKFDEVHGENQNGTSETSNNQTTYQFTQNNYSPKALSKVDIYRQTKNLISSVGG